MRNKIPLYALYLFFPAGLFACLLKAGFFFQPHRLLLLAGGLVCGFVLALIFHEFGHFLGAKTGNAKFVSIQVFGFVLYRKKKKLCLCFEPFSGIFGQCLMKPGIFKKRYFYAYFLGGCALNFLLFLLLSIKALNCLNLWTGSFYFILALMQLAFAYVNIVPMQDGQQEGNDGYLAKCLHSDPNFMRSFCTEMEQEEALLNAKGYKK
jgi:hypothetical protein